MLPIFVSVFLKEDLDWQAVECHVAEWGWMRSSILITRSMSNEGFQTMTCSKVRHHNVSPLLITLFTVGWMKRNYALLMGWISPTLLGWNFVCLVNINGECIFGIATIAWRMNTNMMLHECKTWQYSLNEIKEWRVGLFTSLEPHFIYRRASEGWKVHGWAPSSGKAMEGQDKVSITEQ